MTTAGNEYAGVWVVGEQRNGHLLPVSCELLARGRVLADALHVQLSAVILGPTEGDASDALIAHGADVVIAVPAPALSRFLPEPYTSVMHHLIGIHRPEIVLAGATSSGRTLMPLLAVRCSTGLTADCTDLAIEEETRNLLQIRPAIGGNIMATIRTPSHRPQMATVRPRSTKPLPSDSTRVGQVLEITVPPALLGSRVKHVGFRALSGDSADIQEADIVVSGGRGLRRADGFHLLRELAGLLGGGVGASRVAVDRGWIDYPHQVGLSGKTISPKVYFCLGISGSIQHLAGIKTADRIIAVNTDPEAPIFTVADFGIVGDLFEVLPILIEKIRALKAAGPDQP